MMKNLIRAATIASSVALAIAPFASQAATTTAFGPGDLIKGSGSTVYYFGNDGTRYVFPNEKTYFTWYKDFATVKQLPDGVLSTLPLARKNVTYRPGVKMVKITTDPKVYVVDEGGVLRHVATAQLAESLYGLSWKSDIDDVPDAFFTNYRVGTDIQTVSDFAPKDVTTQTSTIAMDKQLDQSKATVSIGSVENGFVPANITVKKGSTVTWVNEDAGLHNVTASGWHSDNLNYSDSYSWTYNTVGSYDYHDSMFPVMQGTVNVVN